MSAIPTISYPVIQPATTAQQIQQQSAVPTMSLEWGYAESNGFGKVGFRRTEPTFAERKSRKQFRENHPSSPKQDSNLNLLILGSLAQHEFSSLANYATEAGPI
uniref:Uncharacterized protein n=1 Tax=Timema monikensis TaxID=170555 RepID=A0A7R9HMT1_9NEOP|nr:unnamed protein product [Timema monikensis]